MLYPAELRGLAAPRGDAGTRVSRTDPGAVVQPAVFPWKESPLPDLNWRPPDYETDALPTELRGQKELLSVLLQGVLAGFEPTTGIPQGAHGSLLCRTELQHRPGRSEPLDLRCPTSGAPFCPVPPPTLRPDGPNGLLHGGGEVLDSRLARVSTPYLSPQWEVSWILPYAVTQRHACVPVLQQNHTN